MESLGNPRRLQAGSGMMMWLELGRRVQGFHRGLGGFVAAMVLVPMVTGAMAGAEEFSRVVVFSVPQKDLPLVRAELGAAGKTEKLATMDGVLKTRGLKVLIDHTDKDPWRFPTKEDSEAHLYEAAAVSGDEFGDVLPLKSQIWISPEASHLGMRQRLTAMLFLQGKKTFREFNATTDMTWLRANRWEEQMTLGDGQDQWMVWQYITAGQLPPKPEGKPTSEMLADEQYRETYRMEVKLFQVEPADVAKLGKSEPATRENALKWLEDRAKPVLHWQHLSVARHATAISRRESEWPKADASGASSPTTLSSLRVNWSAGGSNGQAAPNQITWSLTYPGSEQFGTPVKTTSDLGVWNFVPIEKVPNVNLLVYRIAKR